MNKHSSKQFINSLANETKSPLLVFRPTNTVAVFSLLELKLRTILSDWGYQFIYEESCYIYNSQLLTGRERCFIDFCFFFQFICCLIINSSLTWFSTKKKSIKNLWSSQNKSMYQTMLWMAKFSEYRMSFENKVPSPVYYACKKQQLSLYSCKHHFV